MINLFLSDVAGSEILLILAFILIFFGSKSIPGLARTLGRTIRQIKDASQELQDEIKKSTNNMKEDFKLDQLIEETDRQIKKPIENITKEISKKIDLEEDK
jgi:sec-independent protein translocase protein TatA